MRTVNTNQDQPRRVVVDARPKDGQVVAIPGTDSYTFTVRIGDTIYERKGNYAEEDADTRLTNFITKFNEHADEIEETGKRFKIMSRYQDLFDSVYMPEQFSSDGI